MQWHATTWLQVWSHLFQTAHRWAHFPPEELSWWKTALQNMLILSHERQDLRFKIWNLQSSDFLDRILGILGILGILPSQKALPVKWTWSHNLTWQSITWFMKIWKCPTIYPESQKMYQKSCAEILQATCSIIKTSRNNFQSCGSVNHLDPMVPMQWNVSSIFKHQAPNVKIWGLDTQIWFWILWQSSYRLGTMTIGACFTSRKSFCGKVETFRRRNHGCFTQRCSPLWKPLRFAVLWFFFPVFLDLWLICRNTPTGSLASSWVSGKVQEKV